MFVAVAPRRTFLGPAGGAIQHLATQLRSAQPDPWWVHLTSFDLDNPLLCESEARSTLSDPGIRARGWTEIHPCRAETANFVADSSR